MKALSKSWQQNCWHRSLDWIRCLVPFVKQSVSSQMKISKSSPCTFRCRTEKEKRQYHQSTKKKEKIVLICMCVIDILKFGPCWVTFATNLHTQTYLQVSVFLFLVHCTFMLINYPLIFPIQKTECLQSTSPTSTKLLVLVFLIERSVGLECSFRPTEFYRSNTCA
jgi:hypothetical protein